MDEVIESVGMPALIEQGGKQTVNARDLHKALEVGKDFSTWIKGRIAQYGFIEGEDYTVCDAYEHCSPKRGSNEPSAPRYEGSQGQIAYFCSLNMAKELAMVEKTEVGKQVRKYFIQCEKTLREQAPQDYLSALKALVASEEAKQLAEAKAIEYHKEAKQKTEEIKNAFVEAGDFTLRDAAKQFGLAPIKEFIPWLFKQEYCYKDQETGRCLPYQDHVQSGMFAIRLAMINGAPRKAVVITSQGMLELNKIITKIKRELL